MTILVFVTLNSFFAYKFRKSIQRFPKMYLINNSDNTYMYVNLTHIFCISQLTILDFAFSIKFILAQFFSGKKYNIFFINISFEIQYYYTSIFHLNILRFEIVKYTRIKLEKLTEKLRCNNVRNTFIKKMISVEQYIPSRESDLN